MIRGDGEEKKVKFGYLCLTHKREDAIVVS